ncbi:MAG: hypothetical protein K6B69_10380 [Lachnospiraceae bacterium]|nr:hypothetical protein [Lachnospiraceae bacterium]
MRASDFGKKAVVILIAKERRFLGVKKAGHAADNIFEVYAEKDFSADDYMEVIDYVGYIRNICVSADQFIMEK